MENIQANVNGTNRAAFLCPHCERPFSISALKLKNTKHEITIRCSCTRRFQLRLNFRRFYRKDVIIIGEVINLSEDSAAWTVMTIVNLSMGGVRFKVLEPCGMQTGDKIRVRFTLDSPQEVTIDKEVIVRNSSNNEFGCEFMSLTNGDTDLKSYLSNMKSS